MGFLHPLYLSTELHLPLVVKAASYLEADVVADQDVSLHELPLIVAVLGYHGEGMVDGGAQDADQRLDTGMGVHVGQVGLHDITGCQSGYSQQVRRNTMVTTLVDS